MRVIVIAPHMDFITSFSAELGFRLGAWAKEKGHDVTILYSIQATRLPFILSLLSEPPFVYYAGHGSEVMWVGNEVIFGLVTPFNAGWLKKKVSATMACDTARVLGPAVINEGGYAYVGALEPLYAAFDEEYNYLEDWFNYMLLLPKGIIENKTIGEALNDLKMKALEYSLFYEREKPDGSWDWYVFSTLTNSRVYTVLGDANLRLSDIVKFQEEQYGKAMSLGQGLQYLFREDVLKAQFPDVLRSLTSFGIIGGLAAGIVAAPVIDFVAEKAGVPKPFAEIAKQAAQVAGTVSPY